MCRNSSLKFLVYQKENTAHCVKSVQIRSFFWSAFSCIQSEYRKIKYEPEKTPYLDTFHTVE